jgi:hypothetical protein
VRASIEKGEAGCLGIASADFDGNGYADYVILLPGRDREKGTMLVAALKEPDDEWIVYMLAEFVYPRWDELVRRLYVKPIPSGTYRRTSWATDRPLAYNELGEYESKLPGFEIAWIDQSYFSYFFARDKWVWVVTKLVVRS